MNVNNFAQKTNWIAGSDQFKTVPFFLTNVNVPGFNLTHTEIGGRNSIKMKLPSDIVNYNNLSFDMLIDEDLETYKELITIINKSINIETGNFGVFDFNFWIQLNNSKGNKVLKIEFNNCKIASISDLNLDTQDETTEYVLTVEIDFDSLNIENTKTLTLQ